jgi:hypothetical protein
MSNSTTVKKGRPSNPDSKVFRNVGLRPAEWEYLSMWFDSTNPSMQVSELINRAVRFWPSGPLKFR